MIFPEGTRHTPTLALEDGTAACPDAAGSGAAHGLGMVAPPRSKAFVASVQQLRGCVDAVYDVTIACVNKPPPPPLPPCRVGGLAHPAESYPVRPPPAALPGPPGRSPPTLKKLRPDRPGSRYNVGHGVTQRPAHCTMETMMRGGFSEVHVHLRRVPMTSMPTTTDHQEQWLKDAFHTKDQCDPPPSFPQLCASA